jgi:hypothetical protein
LLIQWFLGDLFIAFYMAHRQARMGLRLP